MSAKLAAVCHQYHEQLAFVFAFCRLAAEAGVQSETATFADWEHHGLLAVNTCSLNAKCCCCLSLPLQAGCGGWRAVRDSHVCRLGAPHLGCFHHMQLEHDMLLPFAALQAGCGGWRTVRDSHVCRLGAPHLGCFHHMQLEHDMLLPFATLQASCRGWCAVRDTFAVLFATVISCSWNATCCCCLYAALQAGCRGWRAVRDSHVC
jgi:hypothetical protein